MTNIIDRRKNPKDKSLVNRQRFIRRAKNSIKEAIKKSIENKKIETMNDDEGGKVKIPVKDITEPTFQHDPKTGDRQYVVPGNDRYIEGDRELKPRGGDSQRGKRPGDAADEPEEFEFTLSKDEFLDFFFEDLELPDLIKTQLKDSPAIKMKRAGFTTVGSPANLNLERSFKKSLGRRLALNRPKNSEIEELEKQLEILLASNDHQDSCDIQALKLQIENLKKKQKRIPWFDPMDMRYNAFNPNPEPITKAVMFCLMDVSGSMGEREKDIAKRFFMLLYVFLTKKYEKVDIVYIRHTSEAEECTEEQFFYDPKSGGTIVSTCLEKMLEIVKDRYPTSDYNIYGAQASDGENGDADSKHCFTILNNDLMPLVQYYSYIEIAPDRDQQDMFFFGNNEPDLWNHYSNVAAIWKNFAMKKLSNVNQIWSVFKELFQKGVDKK